MLHGHTLRHVVGWFCTFFINVCKWEIIRSHYDDQWGAWCIGKYRLLVLRLAANTRCTVCADEV